MYLADRDTLSYTPDPDELARFERTLVAIWQAIQRATETGDFRASPSRLCDWCDHKPRCPAHGGTPPPYPEPPARQQITHSSQPGDPSGTYSFDPPLSGHIGTGGQGAVVHCSTG